MKDNGIATVGGLIAALSGYDPATPVRIGTGTGYCCLPDSAATALGWS